MTEFQFIDHPKTPEIIKPMTELHDRLVKGYGEGKDLKVSKLISVVNENLFSSQLFPDKEKAMKYINKIK